MFECLDFGNKTDITFLLWLSFEPLKLTQSANVWHECPWIQLAAFLYIALIPLWKWHFSFIKHPLLQSISLILYHFVVWCQFFWFWNNWIREEKALEIWICWSICLKIFRLNTSLEIQTLKRLFSVSLLILAQWMIFGNCTCLICLSPQLLQRPYMHYKVMSIIQIVYQNLCIQNIQLSIMSTNCITNLPVMSLSLYNTSMSELLFLAVGHS